MLSSAASSGGAPSRLERLKRWYRSETIDPVKRSCNLSLLRAVALFAGGVIVARNFGDAFNV